MKTYYNGQRSRRQAGTILELRESVYLKKIKDKDRVRTTNAILETTVTSKKT